MNRISSSWNSHGRPLATQPRKVIGADDLSVPPLQAGAALFSSPHVKSLPGSDGPLLRPVAAYGQVQDYERAANGLQVENRGAVTRIAAAVDASLATVRLAAAAKADLLLVHHGLFWAPAHPWTGKRYELLRCLLEHDLAVYSSHLPLDAHPRLGNNAQLCAALGLKKLRPFFFDHGLFIGFQAKANISRADLVGRLQRATGVKPRVIPGWPEASAAVSAW